MKDDIIIDVKPKKVKSKVNFWFKTCIVFDILVLSCLFVVYGPWAGFRNFWITSAMKTMTHKYFARTFYSEKQITETLNNNSVENLNAETDTSKIVFADGKDTGVYESYYEEQILKRDKNNDLYKYFKIKVNGSNAYVTVIYDPSRIDYVISKKIENRGQVLKDIAADYGAIVAINASGFRKNGTKLVPMGTVIKDGKVLSVSSKFSGNYGLIGFTNDNVLFLTNKDGEEAIKEGMRDAVSFGPFLYINGKPAEIKGNGGGYAPRTVIAQRKDGIVFFVVFDGRSASSLGASMKDLIEILTRYKAYNAANLDGGGSSTLVIENEVINYTGGFGYSGDRYLPDAWIVK